MSTPATATNQPDAPPPMATPKTFNLKQEEIIRQFTEAYGLDRKQISFAPNSSEPIFDFEALSTLSLVLGDIPNIRVEPGDFNNAAGIATAMCWVSLNDNRTREVFGNCLVGEILHDGSPVEHIGQALNTARARALRNGLRAVGFDPVRAHNQKNKEQNAHTELTDVRSKELAEIHILGAELGYIVGDNKVAWRNLISSYFPGHYSSGDLTDLHRSQLLGMLRAWKSARTRAEGSELTKSLVETNES
jgi:hypothetical protein